MTVGEIFIEDDIIFGPAFNRAYHLESEVAEHPRVVIDKAVHQRLHENAVLGDMKYIWRDDDGQFFVDDLVGNIGQLWDFGMEPDLVRETLVVYRELIIRWCGASREELRVDLSEIGPRPE